VVDSAVLVEDSAVLVEASDLQHILGGDVELFPCRHFF